MRGEQLPLFDAPKPKRQRRNSPDRMETEDECSARVCREQTKALLSVPVQCLLHADGHICPDCPGSLETDGYGFVHPSRCRGLIPVRVCRFCCMPVTRDYWSVEARSCTHAGCKESRR